MSWNNLKMTVFSVPQVDDYPASWCHEHSKGWGTCAASAMVLITGIFVTEIGVWFDGASLRLSCCRNLRLVDTTTAAAHIIKVVGGAT